MKKADNPMDFVEKILGSTAFLSVIALAIACGVGWAIWRG